jgi:hypothetical protein
MVVKRDADLIWRKSNLRKKFIKRIKIKEAVNIKLTASFSIQYFQL